MHPVVIYELVKTRMELDRQAERRRRAQAAMQVRHRTWSQRRRWLGAISPHPLIRMSLGDRGQQPPAVAE